jgi:iron-sulfur cluster assembly protein/iron-sulfur cluster insertion protein
MIALTETATSKVKELIEAEGQPELFLRVAVRPGGCSGMSYDMFFDSERAEDALNGRSTADQGRVDLPAPSTRTACRLTQGPARRRVRSRTNCGRTSGCGQSSSHSLRSGCVSPCRGHCVPPLRRFSRGLHSSRLIAVEGSGGFCGVDAEEPRLARDVPRGDGRRRLVGAQVL